METWLAILFRLAWAWPLCLALLWMAPGLRGIGQRLVPWGAAPALGLALVAFFWDLSEETERLLLVFSGLRLGLDATGRTFLLLTSLLWLAAGVFARAYHARDPRRSPLLFFFTLTMTGNLGLVVAADALTFYLFFVLMTFAAYGLVVHRRSAEALRAGRVYIVLAIGGELALLAGLLGLGVAAGGVARFGEPLERVWAALAENEEAALGAGAVGLLLAAGFAVKAGLAPLHLWLPLAHPVAPTPASALLSGAMIKAGLLGWLRFLPAETALPTLATLFVCAGIFSAFYGVVLGLAQDKPKTILAYSSISQMGYMAVGMGLLLSGAEPSALALAGVLLYAVHHGLAKGALFLGVGVVEREGEPARRRRLLLLAALPALMLCGLPATSGALVKGVLKGGLGERWPDRELVALLLFLGAVGTTLLMARFLFALAQSPQAARSGAPGGPGLLARWLPLVALSVTGVLWLPLLLPPPGDAPGMLEGWLGALSPVLAGALCVWIVVRVPSPSALAHLRVPAGDLVVPIERLLAALPRFDQEALAARVQRFVLRAADLRVPLEHLLRRFAREDLRGMWGPVLGASLLALIAALALGLWRT